MIRKFIHVTIFTATISLASFGQEIFGRDDIIHLAERIQKQAPQRVEVALAKTDEALAQLVPEAGSAAPQICTFDNLHWTLKTYKA